MTPLRRDFLMLARNALPGVRSRGDGWNAAKYVDIVDGWLRTGRNRT